MTARAPAVVLGAGPTGLSAAYHLGEGSLLLEREGRVGGLCRSLEDRGFTFDRAGHIMFSKDPYVHRLYRMLLGDNVHWQEREAWVYSKGVHTRYPFQGSLHGLPLETVEECLMGAIEARYGDWRQPLAEARAAGVGDGIGGEVDGRGRSDGPGNGQRRSQGNGHGNGVTNGSSAPDVALEADACEVLEDCCADGILEAELPLVPTHAARGAADPEAPRNFEEFIYHVWGAGIAKHFAIPYNRKLWTVPLDEMETSWLEGRVPLPDLASIIHGALSPAPKPMGPNARFGYPRRGGFQALMDGFLPHLKGELRLNADVVSVSPARQRVTLRGGTEVGYEALVSTLPLPRFVRLLGEEAPGSVRDAAAGLRHVSGRCVNLGIGRADLTHRHWTYYPEDTVFHRIFFQGNASPECNPPGGFGLTCEITYSGSKPLPCEGEALIELCIADCRRVGVLREDDVVLAANQVDLPYAYVVYDHGRADRVRYIRDWLADHRILLAGRYSEWEYYNSDHAFLAGRKVAESVEALLSGRQDGRRRRAQRSAEDAAGGRASV